MLNTSRLFATAALALSLTAAAAAPSSLMPKPDTATGTPADAVIAHSDRPGSTSSTVDCPTTDHDDREQRADRLATMMMHHSMISRLVPSRDIAESASEAVRTAASQHQDDAPRSCG